MILRLAAALLRLQLRRLEARINPRTFDPALSRWRRWARDRRLSFMTNPVTPAPFDESELQRTLRAIEVHRWTAVLLEARQKRPPLGGPWPMTGDPAEVGRHVRRGGNVGLVCHERTGLAVLDPDNLSPWAELIERLGQPVDATVLTGSGKLHYYVEWIEDLPAKLPGGIGEIQRGPGQQQIVCPPSVHPDTGHRYTWLVDPTEALPALPGLWRAYLRGPVYAQRYRR
jgi:Bifunctional DNA primase/polymerase, N-terminal